MSHSTAEPIKVRTEKVSRKSREYGEDGWRFYSGDDPKNPVFRSIVYRAEADLGAAIAGRYPRAIVDGKELGKRFPIEAIANPKPVLSVRASEVEEERDEAAEVARGSRPTKSEAKAILKAAEAEGKQGKKKPVKPRPRQATMFAE
jgi:hypothetical protein